MRRWAALAALLLAACARRAAAIDAMGAALEQDGDARVPRSSAAPATQAPARRTSLAPVARGAELSLEQLAAIGVAATQQSTSPVLPGGGEEAAKATATAPAAVTKKEDEKQEKLKVEAEDAEPPGAAANVSINHVEAHLQILQQLELSVAQSIEEMDARYAKPTGDALRISHELQALKVGGGVMREGVWGAHCCTIAAGASRRTSRRSRRA